MNPAIALRRTCRHRIGRPTGFAVFILVLLTAACTAEPSASPEASTPSVVPTATGDSDEEAAILAAYQAYWTAILAANDPPNEEHPGLLEHATGEAYDAAVKATHANRLARRAVRLPQPSSYRHDATVVHIGTETATVRDCAVDDGLVINLDRGEVVNDEVATRLASAELVRVQGVWKVSKTHVEATWEGVAGCAA